MAIAYSFDDILLKGIRDGKMPARTRKARDWYRAKARETGINQSALVGDKERLRSQFLPGAMYFFVYDPKTKKKLPYYDRFPLVVVMESAPGGFLGLNLHYLPYAERAKLMDALYTITNNKKYDDRTRIKATYDTLKSAGKFRNFKPCIKRYLTGHVKSRFVYVNPSEWDIALFLPVENFKKASKSKVWAESRGMI